MPKSLADIISKKAEALVGAPDDFNSIVDLVGDARLVLIGEASHGTHEFYRIRAQISKILIAQRGFIAIAVEAEPCAVDEAAAGMAGATVIPAASAPLTMAARAQAWD